MGLKPFGAVGVTAHVIPVGIAVAEGDMHHRAGERGVGAGTEAEMDVGRLRRPGAVGIDHDELRPPLLPRPGDVGHDVDLGGDGIGAPHHDEIGPRHFARIRPPDAAHPRLPARLGEIGADGRLLPRITHGVAQTVDPVALHEPHRARVVIGPDRLRPEPPRRREEGLGHAVERLVPGDRAELARALGAGAQHGLGQAFGVVDALGIARHLGADHARGVGVGGSAAHRADPPPLDHLDFERAGGGAVMRTDRRPDFLAHPSPPPAPGRPSSRHPNSRQPRSRHPSIRRQPRQAFLPSQ